MYVPRHTTVWPHDHHGYGHLDLLRAQRVARLPLCAHLQRYCARAANRPWYTPTKKSSHCRKKTSNIAIIFLALIIVVPSLPVPSWLVGQLFDPKGALFTYLDNDPVAAL